ncbi:porphobilinogen synthase, partial [Staphylococcus aureus]|nr:porphobilinogen synthase [Staphylococcus aureus]
MVRIVIENHHLHAAGEQQTAGYLTKSPEARDTCFCEYTSHGHCGVLCEHGVDNDATLVNLGRQAVVAAAAGADFIAPSAAMDGQVKAIRQALDAAGFTDTAIFS